MKKAMIPLALFIVLLLSSCRGGNVSMVEIPDWEPSEIYTDAEIGAAFQTVKDYFSREFDGCALTKLYYPGDTFSGEFAEWAERYDADEAIVIYSDFAVDASGGDGSLMPNSTYEDWQWVLVRDGDGKWRHVTHGYG